jgi:hypothetical protein
MKGEIKISLFNSSLRSSFRGQRKRTDRLLLFFVRMRFVSNATGTAFLACSGPLSIQTPEDFISVSPYSPTGSKPSSRYYNQELMGRGSIPSSAIDGKTYYGDKTYINARIGYNKCLAAYGPSSASKSIPQQYVDFSSSDQAFDYANQLFRGNLPLVQGNSIADTFTGGTGGRSLFTNPTSQLLDESDYQSLFGSSATIAGEPNVSFEGNLAPPNDDVGILTGVDGRRYVSYPNTNIYFQCPSSQQSGVSALTPEQSAQMGRRFTDYAARHDLKDKTIYCGKEIADIIKAKACGILTDQTAGVSSGRLPESLTSLRFGTPGQCFAYGRSYNRPEAAAAFRSYLRD